MKSLKSLNPVEVVELVNSLQVNETNEGLRTEAFSFRGHVYHALLGECGYSIRFQVVRDIQHHGYGMQKNLLNKSIQDLLAIYLLGDFSHDLWIKEMMAFSNREIEAFNDEDWDAFHALEKEFIASLQS